MSPRVKELAWPWETSTLRWCPGCKFWTVPRDPAGNVCRCGVELTKWWQP